MPDQDYNGHKDNIVKFCQTQLKMNENRISQLMDHWQSIQGNSNNMNVIRVQMNEFVQCADKVYFYINISHF